MFLVLTRMPGHSTVGDLGLCCVSSYVYDVCRTLLIPFVVVSRFVPLHASPTVMNSNGLISTFAVHSS